MRTTAAIAVTACPVITQFLILLLLVLKLPAEDGTVTISCSGPEAKLVVEQQQEEQWTQLQQQSALEYFNNMWRKSAAEVKRQVLLRAALDVQQPNDDEKDTPHLLPSSTANWAKSQKTWSLGLRAPDSHFLRLLTYNIWNKNPPWRERLYRIAMMIEETMPDIVALQELRIPEKQPQLQFLEQILPPGLYQYSYYHKMHSQSKEDGKEEGLAVLSRHRIVHCSAYFFDQPKDVVIRTQKRGFLDVTVNVSSNLGYNGLLNVLVVHLGYEDLEQCRMVRQLAQHANEAAYPSAPQVIIGDFNTYFDFPWPVDFFTASHSLRKLLTSPLCPCASIFTSAPASFVPFRDAWIEVQQAGGNNMKAEEYQAPLPDDPILAGNTFPTGAIPIQDPSRPDRILLRGSLSVVNATLLGQQLVHGLYVSDHAGLMVDLVPD